MLHVNKTAAMSEEEIELDSTSHPADKSCIEKWLALWPGNEDILPELMSMREGILAGFVEDFLVENARPESYVNGARKGLELKQLEGLDSEGDDEDEADLERDFLEQAELEIRQLEDIENELEARVSEKLRAQQLQGFHRIKAQPMKKDFLLKTRHSHFLDIKISEACHNYKRINCMPEAMSESSRPINEQKQYTDMMESNMSIFKETMADVTNVDYSSVTTSFLTHRDRLSSGLKRCLEEAVSRFHTWWNQELSKDFLAIEATAAEASDGEDTVSYVSYMNQLFYNQVRHWTDLHVTVGTENAEMELEDSGEWEASFCNEQDDEDNNYIALDLAVMEEQIIYFNFFKNLDFEAYITEIQLYPENSYLNDDSYLDGDPESYRDLLVEFICVLLRTWPGIRLKFEVALRGGFDKTQSITNSWNSSNGLSQTTSKFSLTENEDISTDSNKSEAQYESIATLVDQISAKDKSGRSDSSLKSLSSRRNSSVLSSRGDSNVQSPRHESNVLSLIRESNPLFSKSQSNTSSSKRNSSVLFF